MASFLAVCVALSSHSWHRAAGHHPVPVSRPCHPHLPSSPPSFPSPMSFIVTKTWVEGKGREGWRNGRRSYTDMAARRRAREKEEGVSNVQNNTLWRLLLLRCRSVGWNEMKMGIFFQPAERGREVASLRDGGSRYHFSRSPPRGAKQKYPIPPSLISIPQRKKV